MLKICKHFSQCGGCKFQDLPYSEQLKIKEEQVRKKLSVYNIDTQVKPINSYPEFFYRGKMEFSFYYQDKIICGLHSKLYKRQVFDLEECLIFSQDVGSIMAMIKDYVNSHGYSSYNKRSHQGFLRYLIIRETKFTNQLMIGVVTTSQNQLDTEQLVEKLLALKLKGEIKSIFWVINDSWSDAVVFQKNNLLYGQPFIQEELDGFKFNIGIDTFFQVNSQGVRDLYSKITQYAQLTTKEKILDLCCGTGTIGIFLSKWAYFVWGIDIGREIIDAAWENAKLNNVNNISFLLSDIRHFLNSQGMLYKDIDLAVINPPRSGLSDRVIRAILRLAPKKIIYSSCNINSLGQNLQDLSAAGYKIDFIEPFDFFPHTPHVECLAVIKKA